MRIGKLRHRVDVQRYSTGYDSEGEPIQDWQPLVNVWAAVEPLKGEEFFAAMGAQAKVSHKVTMRHPGVRVKPSDRLVVKGRAFDIKSVIDVEERGIELVLMCEERVG